MATYQVFPDRPLGTADERLYGQFIEHHHRQIYGGVWQPGHRLSDEAGFRVDVLEALQALRIPCLRWPGGCFVSSYHWKDGVGQRVPAFDKAWRVEESNAFGTDEFMELCRRIGCQPYLCTNAGSGTSEEMSDWVEYCNLESAGRWARLRRANGHPQPYGVRYWSIGNENWGDWEIGAKELSEWGPFVRESAKMMKHVDPTIELFAASIADLDWNVKLLRDAGSLLDWISIHGYWTNYDGQHEAAYEECMATLPQVEEQIVHTKHILGALGMLGRIKVAFDEWNLRHWYHPDFEFGTGDYLSPRAYNDDDTVYTLADAVFAAGFLHACMRHSDVVRMANFSPVVNSRGAIHVHEDGLVLRPTYHVFQLYREQLGSQVLDSYSPDCPSYTVQGERGMVALEQLDALATRRADGRLALALVNRHATQPLQVRLSQDLGGRAATLYTLAGRDKDDCNTKEHPNRVRVEQRSVARREAGWQVELPAHSVNVLVL